MDLRSRSGILPAALLVGVMPIGLLAVTCVRASAVSAWGEADGIAPYIHDNYDRSQAATTIQAADLVVQSDPLTAGVGDDAARRNSPPWVGVER